MTTSVALLRVLLPSPGDDTLDRAVLDRLLQQYVNEEGSVNYSRWKERDVPELDRYLDMVRKAAPSRFSRNEAVAFWINVYNALTIRAILEFYPVKSIKDKASWLIGYNVWKDYKIAIEGKDLSLNDMEHKILRSMGEPRIHFALVCAARGCPRLRNHAYTGAKLSDELDANARHFFARFQNYRLDRAKRTVYLSSILKWYGGDFGSKADRMRAWSKYLSAEDAEFLKGDVDIEYIDYDWALNEQ